MKGYTSKQWQQQKAMNLQRQVSQKQEVVALIVLFGLLIIILIK